MSNWYRTGVMNSTVGSAIVNGVSSYWQTATDRVEAGDILTINNRIYEIMSVDSDVQLTLDRGFEAPNLEAAGSQFTNQSYAIIRNTSATVNTRIAAQVTSVLKKLGDRITVSTAAPTAGQGNDGDIWIVPVNPVI